jgi:heme/copper-type cytochrome/quinol oxidase subunit 2
MMSVQPDCGCGRTLHDMDRSRCKSALQCCAAIKGAILLWCCLAGGCESRDSANTSTSHKDSEAAQQIVDSVYIQLTGTEHRWKAEYLATDSGLSECVLRPLDMNLHVPVGASVVFILKSSDYVYTLAIPAFGLKEIAVPDLEFRMAFRPMRMGLFPFVGEELCGAPGQVGPGQLIVESLADYQAWFRRNKNQNRVHRTLENTQNAER